MRAILFIAIVSITQVSCAKALQDFVQGAQPDRAPPQEQVGGATNERQGLKISNGAITGKGTTYGVQMTIGPSQTALTGTHLGARVGILQDNTIR